VCNRFGIAGRSVGAVSDAPTVGATKISGGRSLRGAFSFAPGKAIKESLKFFLLTFAVSMIRLFTNAMGS
jgi:hypothetical protein